MDDRYRRGRRTEGGGQPLRRLSSIGGTTSGWRSSLETNPRESFGSFLVGLLIAAAAFALIALLLVVLGSLGQ